MSAMTDPDNDDITVGSQASSWQKFHDTESKSDYFYDSITG